MSFKILPADSSQLNLFENGKEEDFYNQASDLLRENFLSVLKKMIDEAAKGNIQAAKFLYPYFPDLLNPELEKPDIWDILISDDDQRARAF